METPAEDDESRITTAAARSEREAVEETHRRKFAFHEKHLECLQTSPRRVPVHVAQSETMRSSSFSWKANFSPVFFLDGFALHFERRRW